MVVATQVPAQPSPVKKLRRLNNENERLRLEVANARLKRQKQRMAVESTALNTLIDRNDYLPVGFGLEQRATFGVNTYNTLNDRHEGKNAPFIETEIDAAYARGLARWIAGSNGPAVGCGENLKNYVIKTGFKFGVAARRPLATSELIADVKSFIDELLRANKWACDLDRELYWRWERDGEMFLALYFQPDGLTYLRVVEPEQIVDPHSDTAFEADYLNQYGVCHYATNWRFGIRTADHDVQTVLGYCVQWGPGEGLDYLPAAMVVHWKNNVDRNIKRGLSSFYPIWKWLRKEEELLSKTADGASRLAAIAYIVQYALATQDQVKSMRRQQANTKKMRTSVDGGNTEEYRRQTDSSDVVDLPLGQEYKEGPHGAERGNAFLEIVQGLLRHVAARFCMPEYMVSGDASNNNYASAVVAGGPFVNFCESRQGMAKTQFEDMLLRCLEHAHRCGRFKSHNLNWEAMRDAIELTIVPPDVQPDTVEETNRRKVLVDGGAMSMVTWQEAEGLDPAKEAARGARAVAVEGMGPAGAGGAVQDTALNGAQVSSLLDMLAKATSGEIPAGSVGPMIAAAFPAMSQEQIAAITAPLGKTAEAVTQGGSFMKINRQQWLRIEKAVKDIAGGLQAGTTTPALATVFLQNLGLNPEQAKAVIADAQDGNVEPGNLVESLHQVLYLEHQWASYP